MNQDELVQILGSAGLEVCGKIGRSFLAGEYYLAGGTGLAIQIKHRRSFDLDFFQKSSREKISLTRIDHELRRLFGIVRMDFKQVDQASWHVQGIKLTFMAYPFALIYPLVKGESISSDLKGLYLAAPAEIALMKAYALGRRATIRDYVDMYFLIKREMISLARIIADAGRKYVMGGESLFSPRLFLEQLIFLEDLEDREALPDLVFSRLTVQDIEHYFMSIVTEYLEKSVGQS